jgi:DNA-binding CsgD family transcriptional regulator
MVRTSRQTVNSLGAVTTSAELRRWLALGRDVVLRGDHGAGKSTALRSLRADLSGRRRPGILVRGAGPGELATLLDHPSQDDDDPTGHQLLRWLVEELGAPRSVLMLDDLDQVDAASVRLVHRALRRTGAALVATTTVNPLRLEVPEARSLLATRAPAAVRVRPLDLAAVSAMLGTLLGAPADTGLTTALLAQSGGNPGAIAALVAAARAGGALRQVDGHWTVAGSLTDVPADALAFQFLGRLREELVAGLLQVAAIGPVPADEAMRVVDPEVLHELIDRGRLVNHPVAPAGDVLVAAPPALARALRQSVSTVERRRAAARASANIGRRLDPVLLREDDLPGLVDADLSEEEGFLRWTTELAGLVHEQEQIAESTARAAWLADSSVAHANAYLALLMLRYATTQIDGVFATTVLSQQDTAADRLTFRSYHLSWLSAQGVAEDELRARTAGWGDDARALVDVHGLKDRAVAAVRQGEPASAVLAVESARHEDPLVQGRRVLALAAAALEVGQPGTALALCDSHRGAGTSVTSRHHLAALRVLALLLLGRVAEAERDARGHLSAAYDAYDTLGIRLYACVLAETLTFGGRLAAAWRVLSTSLVLGPAGPLDEAFYRRGLTIGVMLQVNAGQATMSAALVRELDATARGARSIISSLDELARAAHLRRTGVPAEAVEAGWQAARGYADAGLLHPALLSWAYGPPSLTPERAQQVRDVWARASVPLLDPYLALQVALAEGDVDAGRRAVGGVDPVVAPSLARAAAEVLGVGAAPANPAAGADGRVAPPTEPLTAREREIAQLVRSGLANRQIAGQLHISVRTVENHVSRVLRKLRLSGRAELSSWQDDGAGAA